VIKYFQKTNQIIFLVWHSFGGLTIIYSNTKNINWIILRDASIGGNKLLDDVSYNKKTHTYEINRWDWVIHTIWTTMYKDFLVSPQKHLTRISKIHVPIKIICAERSLNIWDKYNRDAYYKSANEPKDLIIIPGSGHHFKEKWAEKKLFTETYKRIKEYS
jgi:pimeloyl-ACP methyl ester carboxylesterase